MNKRAYFFLIPAAVSRDNYAHASVVVAEGLVGLGYEIYANLNYWRGSPRDCKFLFKHDPEVRPEDCAFNVLTYDWMHYVNVMPYELVENRKSVRVYLEDAGWLKTPALDHSFRIFDVVFRAHFNRQTTWPSNVRPWAFGLSNRIISETRSTVPFDTRRRAMLVNFGTTHAFRHQLREWCDVHVHRRLEALLEIDRTTNSREEPPTDSYHRLMWEQTSGRHYPDYYQRLLTSVACSCVGGQLMPGLPEDWSLFYGSGGYRLPLRRLGYGLLSRVAGRLPRWNQWESWRFWECLAAGCASVMLDFEKYGVELPVQPENWTHYIGFDLNRIDAGIDRIASDPGVLHRVADAGRSWALQHYAPAATGRRFLEALGVLA